MGIGEAIEVFGLLFTVFMLTAFTVLTPEEDSDVLR